MILILVVGLRRLDQLGLKHSYARVSHGMLLAATADFVGWFELVVADASDDKLLA